jgi:hypothetical protein
VLNREVTKEVFEKTKESILANASIRERFLLEFHKLRMSEPFVAFKNLLSENCTGDFITESKNVHSSFLVLSTENAKYCYNSGYLTKNMYDGMNAGGTSDILYEAQHTHFQYHSAFLTDVDHCQEAYLCELCDSCKHCFGCVGLRNKQYCVFNKQYSKEEYEALVPKIIEHMRGTGEWGEFFPSSISPFGYNETVAQEYYPMTREEVLARGQKFTWSDYEPPFPKVEKTIPASKLPTDITQVPDDILNWAVECEVTGKPFRIVKQELEFYRKHHLPIPRRPSRPTPLRPHSSPQPEAVFSNGRAIVHCAKNHAAPDGKPTKFLTTYSPDRSEKVYCEKCYAKEVAG